MQKKAIKKLKPQEELTLLLACLNQKDLFI